MKNLPQILVPAAMAVLALASCGGTGTDNAAGSQPAAASETPATHPAPKDTASVSVGNGGASVHTGAADVQMNGKGVQVHTGKVKVSVGDTGH